MFNEPKTEPNPEAKKLAEKYFKAPEADRETERAYLERTLEKAAWLAEQDGKPEVAEKKRAALDEFRRLIGPGPTEARANIKRLEKQWRERKREEQRRPRSEPVSQRVRKKIDRGLVASQKHLEHLEKLVASPA